MELATPVRIHRSVVLPQSRLLARRHFHVPAQDVVRAFAQSTYELGVGVFEYSLP